MAWASTLKLQDSGDSAAVEASAGRSRFGDLLSPLCTFWSGGWLRGYGWITAVGAVLLVSGLTATTSPIHARLYGHDIFFLLDNGWRALHGQRVHLDYSSAWGPLTFLLIAGGLAVSGTSVAAVGYTNALVALATGLWSLWLAAARSRSVTVIAYPCLVALLVAAPFALGDPPLSTSHGMVYNRYGYALLAIIMIECLHPSAESKSSNRTWIEPVLTGCATSLLLFLKITYFLVALLFLAASLLFWNRRKARATGYLTGFIAVTLLFLAYLRFDVAAMVTDLLAAGAARRGSLGARHEFASLVEAVRPAVLLGVLAFGCARLSGASKISVPRWQAGRYCLIAIVVVAADCMLCLTNAQSSTYPLAAIFALVLLFSIEPSLLSSAPLPSRTEAAFVVAIAGVLVVPLALEQVGGLAYGLVEARVNSNPAGVLRFESPRLRALVLYDLPAGDIDRYSNGREYVASLNDGMRLLAAHTGPKDKVATLDMFNPFAYALDREPIRGGIAAAAYRYTLDDAHHPAPARFFGDAAVVMVPKYPASPAIFFEGYRRIYQPAIDREFRLEAESARWKLYRRVTQQGQYAAIALDHRGVD
jgi:hypothetical protein